MGRKTQYIMQDQLPNQVHSIMRTGYKTFSLPYTILKLARWSLNVFSKEVKSLITTTQQILSHLPSHVKRELKNQ